MITMKKTRQTNALPRCQYCGADALPRSFSCERCEALAAAGKLIILPVVRIERY